MLLQFILIISVISSSARTIDTNRTTSLDPVEIVNQRDPEGHRDKRQLFVFNNDIGQILNRAIDSLGIIRDGYQVGRLFTTSISNMMNGTDIITQPRTIQNAFQVFTGGVRDFFFGYFRRMGLIQ